MNKIRVLRSKLDENGDFDVHTIKNELLSKQQALAKLRDQNHLEF